MPFYYRLRRRPAKDRRRIAGNIMELRTDLREVGKIPRRTTNDTLLLATWNLRDFDSNKFGYGPRLDDSFYYIAEVISAFDIIALQEVGEDLAPLEHLMDILGPMWSFIATDITEGSGGNRERMTFAYDKTKVLFRNIAGEIVLPDNLLLTGEKQFARTPFLVSFQAGWFKFSLCTVHIYYGEDTGEKLERRIAEIDGIAKFLANRAKKEQSNLILLGDFNVVSPQHQTMEALLKHKFMVPDVLRQKTNLERDKFYDQIAFMPKRDVLALGDSDPHAGVYDPYHVVYNEAEHDTYNAIARQKTQYFQPEKLNPKDQWNFMGNGKERTEAAKRSQYLHKWRTWQISDHLPLWVELKIDFTDEYLQGLMEA
jgi:endonuclease/exonuclease/phosphatase family metal-dependent hydrolase